ncbi:hypothetical protein [Flavobacterium sp. WV_118_3]|nr:hypothetical protein [Flavobacterium sp.]
MTTMNFGNIYGANPWVKIHSAYKIICDQTGTASDFGIFFQ